MTDAKTIGAEVGRMLKAEGYSLLTAQELDAVQTKAYENGRIDQYADDQTELSELRLQLIASVGEALAALGRVAELEKDAARYRHVRDGAYVCVIPHGRTLNGRRTAWITLMYPEVDVNSYDAAIDAARGITDGAGEV